MSARGEYRLRMTYGARGPHVGTAAENAAGLAAYIADRRARGIPPAGLLNDGHARPDTGRRDGMTIPGLLP